MKKKFDVTFYYHTNLTITVEAENEEEAKRLAEAEEDNECNVSQLLAGLQHDGATDVYEHEN